MQTEETKDNGTKDGSTDFGCCNPEDFRKVFEKKFKCFPCQGDDTDFSALKEGMMDKMMGMMPEMMMEMMPQCLKVMLPNIPKEKRIDFVLKMSTTLVEQGCMGMPEEEKKDFVAKVVKKVTI